MALCATRISASPSRASTGLPLLVLRARRGKLLLVTSTSMRLPAPKRVMDVAEIDRHRIDAVRRQRLRLGGRVAIHRPDHPVHQQHGAPVRLLLDQLGDEIGVGAVRLHLQCDPDIAGDRQIAGSGAPRR